MSTDTATCCSICGAPAQGAIGILGLRILYRCRACGWLWSEGVPADEDYDIWPPDEEE